MKCPISNRKSAFIEVGTTPMDGEQFVNILTNELDINLSAATKTQWRSKKTIATILRNAFRTFERQRLTHAVVPVVEFHHLNFWHNNNVDTFAKRMDNKDLL